MFKQRHGFIQQLLQEENLAALVVFGPADLRYLCGFTGSDGFLFITRSATSFHSDSRYQQQAQLEVCADQIYCYKNKLQALADIIAETDSHRVGFDGRVVSVAQYQSLQQLTQSGGVELVPLSDQLASLRSIKSSEELTALKHAATLNRHAFENILPQIRAGVSEREVALELEFCLKKLGGEANAFDFIVASGVRGALPHGVASNKLIATGELVTIDFGTRYAGYCSDETVTLAVGDVDGKLRQIFDIVLEAHDSAIRAAKPGMRACDLDAVARDLIVAKGYGEYFGHGLGHGVGMDVHEFPALTTKSDTLLTEGMVVTIEPGIYLPGFGGVRIEDTIVMTADGCECLTSIPKEYLQLTP